MVPVNLLLGVVTCFGLMGLVIYLPMRLAGLFGPDPNS